MKTPFIFSGTFTLLIAATSFGQGTFQDLDFEQATIPSGTQFSVSAANALPGWTVDYGNTVQTQIGYDYQSLGGTAAILTGIGSYLPAIDGNYSIELYGGREEISLSQTAQIPVGTHSLYFEGGWFPQGPNPAVSIGNDNLTLFSLGGGRYGADVSAWSGQTEELKFTVRWDYGPYFFDDISFSPGAVPEPSPVLLTGITAALFGAWRHFSSKRK